VCAERLCLSVWHKACKLRRNVVEGLCAHMPERRVHATQQQHAGKSLTCAAAVECTSPVAAVVDNLCMQLLLLLLLLPVRVTAGLMAVCLLQTTCRIEAWQAVCRIAQALTVSQTRAHVAPAHGRRGLSVPAETTQLTAVSCQDRVSLSVLTTALMGACTTHTAPPAGCLCRLSVLTTALMGACTTHTAPPAGCLCCAVVCSSMDAGPFQLLCTH
jgi:hypothetical protein